MGIFMIMEVCGGAVQSYLMLHSRTLQNSLPQFMKVRFALYFISSKLFSIEIQ